MAEANALQHFRIVRLGMGQPHISGKSAKIMVAEEHRKTQCRGDTAFVQAVPFKQIGQSVRARLSRHDVNSCPAKGKIKDRGKTRFSRKTRERLNV